MKYFSWENMILVIELFEHTKCYLFQSSLVQSPTQLVDGKNFFASPSVLSFSFHFNLPKKTNVQLTHNSLICHIFLVNINFVVILHRMCSLHCLRGESESSSWLYFSMAKYFTSHSNYADCNILVAILLSPIQWMMHVHVMLSSLIISSQEVSYKFDGLGIKDYYKNGSTLHLRWEGCGRFCCINK